jgi:ORF6N domain
MSGAQEAMPTPLDVGEIAQRIQLIRGQRVILDTDLAAFYGETTKRFNQQVRRNLARFPADFMFQLDAEEAQSLRLQFATLDAADQGSKEGKPGRGRYSKYLPMAFTEHGAIMAATLLNSPRATEISVHVVRAFVQWRSMLATNRELSQKLYTLERKVSQHDGSIGELIEAMRQLLAEPEVHKRPIGFVHPREASKPKLKELKASAAKKAAIAAPPKAVRKK